MQHLDGHIYSESGEYGTYCIRCGLIAFYIRDDCEGRNDKALIIKFETEIKRLQAMIDAIQGKKDISVRPPDRLE